MLCCQMLQGFQSVLYYHKYGFCHIAFRHVSDNEGSDTTLIELHDVAVTVALARREGKEQRIFG